MATFPKSGTTFMSNVCHQLRSKCTANDFEEITEIVPWIDLVPRPASPRVARLRARGGTGRSLARAQALDLGQDLDADQTSEPRLFKSHMNPSNVNAGCKVLLVTRDPVRVLLSYYAFAKPRGLPFMVGMDSALDLVDHPMWMQGPMASSSKRGNVWQFLVEIWFARKKAGVLVVPYEDAVKDPKTWIQKTADFIGVDCDAALVEDVVKHSDKQYMLDHVSQFDDHWIAQQQAKVGRTTCRMQTASKVTQGAYDKPEGLEEKMQEKWDLIVKPVTGHATYAAMLADLSS